MYEFAKLSVCRAYVPYVPMHLTCLRAFVPQITTCLRALCYYVPTCLRDFVPQITTTCLSALHYYVPTCLKLLRALIFTCLRAYVPIYIFQAYAPLCHKLFRSYVRSFFTCLRGNISQNILRLTSILCCCFSLDYVDPTFH